MLNVNFSIRAFTWRVLLHVKNLLRSTLQTRNVVSRSGISVKSYSISRSFRRIWPTLYKLLGNLYRLLRLITTPRTFPITQILQHYTQDGSCSSLNGRAQLQGRVCGRQRQRGCYNYDNTIKGKAANANDKIVLLRKQNESKAEEAIHKALKATIASLETAIKSTYG